MQSPDVWEAVRQLTETAERIRGSRALVPRGVHRFETFEEAHEWMLEKVASTHASQGRKNSEILELDGVEIPIASLETLIKTKQTVRPHDAADREFLERLRHL